ncbi:MAG: hypothetical protein PHY43_11095 [Verrucomicrobiales bacterium]|nr:hypothetical protein [Verrucomicrobiales bacterium]
MSSHSELGLPILSPIQKQRNKLLFGVQRSVHYHARRRQFFDRIGFVTSFLTVVSGGATVTVSIGAEPEHRIYTIVFGSLVALFAALDLIIGCSKTARDHNDLCRNFLGLQREIVLAGNEITDKQLNEFVAKRLEIEEEEPPKLRVLDILCHNELIKASGKNIGHMVEVGKFQRILADVLDISADKLEKSMHKKSGQEA